MMTAARTCPSHPLRTPKRRSGHDPKTTRRPTSADRAALALLVGCGSDRGADAVQIAIYVGSADGPDERLVAVTDEEDINLGSYPVWQPASAKLVPATGAMAPRKQFDFCLRRLEALRQKLSKTPATGT